MLKAFGISIALHVRPCSHSTPTTTKKFTESAKVCSAESTSKTTWARPLKAMKNAGHGKNPTHRLRLSTQTTFLKVGKLNRTTNGSFSPRVHTKLVKSSLTNCNRSKFLSCLRWAIVSRPFQILGKMAQGTGATKALKPFLPLHSWLQPPQRYSSTFEWDRGCRKTSLFLHQDAPRRAFPQFRLSS